MIRVLLVDDEALAVQRLEIKLSHYEDVDVIGTAHDGDAAIEALSKLKPDLLLLDISMPGANGLAVAEKAAELGIMVIFVTAFAQYAAPAFETEAVDYLLKPVSTRRLGAAFNRYRERKSLNSAIDDINALKSVIAQLRSRSDGKPQQDVREGIWIKDKGRKQKIILEDIEWVEAARDYVSLHMTSGQYHFVRDSMRNIEKKLGSQLFQRVHRSAIVNLTHITKIISQDGTQVLHMKSGTDVRVGRFYKSTTNLRLKEVITT